MVSFLVSLVRGKVTGKKCRTGITSLVVLNISDGNSTTADHNVLFATCGTKVCRISSENGW